MPMQGQCMNVVTDKHRIMCVWVPIHLILGNQMQTETVSTDSCTSGTGLSCKSQHTDNHTPPVIWCGQCPRRACPCYPHQSQFQGGYLIVTNWPGANMQDSPKVNYYPRP